MVFQLISINWRVECSVSGGAAVALNRRAQRIPGQ